MFEDIGSDGWHRGEPIEFLPDSTAMTAVDRHKSAEITAIIRYSSRGKLKELPVAMVAESYAGTLSSDTVSFTLFDEKGDPAGHGNHGVFEQTVSFRVDSLPEGWRLNLIPLTDADGIVSAGIRID